MDHLRAFALVESHELDTFGGSVAMPDGSTFRVDDHLREGGGIIVTDDPVLIDVLNGYFPLKHVAVPEAVERELSGTIDELRDYAAKQEPPIELPANARKQQIIDTIEAEEIRRRADATSSDAAAAEASIETVPGGENNGDDS